MKKKIQIHKNSLKDYFVKKGTYKLGKEEMVRWVDIPEYLIIVIESNNVVDAKEIEKLEDTERGVRLGDWSSTQHYCKCGNVKLPESNFCKDCI